jgi:hypothetical protein
MDMFGEMQLHFFYGGNIDSCHKSYLLFSWQGGAYPFIAQIKHPYRAIMHRISLQQEVQQIDKNKIGFPIN